MEFAKDLRILLKETCLKLKGNNIKFCLVGGWAVSILGIPRATVDIDILIILDDNIKNQVISILSNSFQLVRSHEKDLEFKNIKMWRNIVSLKGKTEPFIIDFIKADTYYLKKVIGRSIEIEYEDIVIPVVSLEDLIVIKMASFLKQDQVDIENLIQSNPILDWSFLERMIKENTLDWNYLAHWVK